MEQHPRQREQPLQNLMYLKICVQEKRWWAQLWSLNSLCFQPFQLGGRARQS